VAGKFQIRSKKWDTWVLVGSIVLLTVGFGGIFGLQYALSDGGAGGPTLSFVVLLGFVALGFFAGPGIVYASRKRIPALKKRLPGGTLPWIRSHLYLPALALVAAFVHGTAVPFRANFSTGKLLILLGVLVSIAGVARHHLIGIQKAAINVDVAISKLTVGQPRQFRRLVAAYTDNTMPLADIEAQMATFDAPQQERWKAVKELRASVDKHFPREGGQRSHIRQYKVWRAIHVPLTIALFVVLGFHLWDALGGTRAVSSEKDNFASAQTCAGCHSQAFSEWATSSMAHAQDSTITKAQLPITLAENQKLADQLGQPQKDILDLASKTCINCHAQVGARFAENIDALFPLGAENSASTRGSGTAVSGGGDAVQSDGVSCLVCHSQAVAAPELAAAGSLLIDPGPMTNYGVQYGPLFSNPNPLPQRAHGIGNGDDSVWSVGANGSQLCGACHNVKIDMDGDGVAIIADDRDPGLTQTDDANGNFQLDANELDDSNGDGRPDDLVLQTTYDEWQDYVAFFDKRFAGDDRQQLAAPLGCTECHMPTEGDGTSSVVDHTPGITPNPDRSTPSHSFVGVDYDLDPSKYTGAGMPSDALQRVLAERTALVQSAVTLDVTDPGTVSGSTFTATVDVRNNLLGHSFPTGFAFARQFWLEVSAQTEDGKPVCLSDLTDSTDAVVVTSPCASGMGQDGNPIQPAEDLRQCDPKQVADAAGLAVTDIVNADIVFPTGASFSPDACDPWLTNFQKILTDGDPEKTGTLHEIPYQPFVGDAVKVRERVATQTPMNELQPVRLRADANGDLQPDDTGHYDYQFDTSGLDDGTKVIVTAKMRFRHLPPYFVHDIQNRQGEITSEGFNVPTDAAINADDLLKNMVITDVVEAKSGEGPQLACKGPQNGVGTDKPSILDCVPNDFTVSDASAVSTAGISIPVWLAALIILLAVIVTIVSIRRTRARERRRSSDRVAVGSG